jgi:hypothetical protein
MHTYDKRHYQIKAVYGPSELLKMHGHGFLIQTLSRVRRPAHMPRVLLHDLWERVIAAIDGGMSCRAAASAIR